MCLRCEAKPQSERERISNILRAKLEAARIRRFAAENTLKDIASEVPGTLPASDGVLRIRKAGREHQEALKAVELAVRNLNDFLLNGRVPPELDLGKDSAREQRKPSRE